ncbi:hypothetical protein Sjap_000886 [Stephania japonica]|uniref:Mitochondrial transcription termination factor n=1 Tax=Stephania japonica TaxID=461633 RepID=A0AAP0KIY9_9MAGN
MPKVDLPALRAFLCIQTKYFSLAHSLLHCPSMLRFVCRSGRSLANPSKEHSFATLPTCRLIQSIPAISTGYSSLLSLFKTYGFTETQIKHVIQMRPKLLILDPHKTLKPKLDFFRSVGVADRHLPKFATVNVMRRSLDKCIIPAYHLLKTIVKTDTNMISMMKRSIAVLLQNPQKPLLINVGVLRDEGVSESNIVFLLVDQPRALLYNSDKFSAVVRTVKGMGFDPSTRVFTIAIQGLTSMSKSTWESKLEAYRSWGLSEEDVRLAFRKQPFCMIASEEKIMRIMDFLVNKMGYDATLIAKYPAIILLSLEKRIVPRCLVVQALVSKGLFGRRKCSIYSVLKMTEENFFKRFVVKFKKEVPHLLDLYEGRSVNVSKC